ncbi:hypothetical protein F0562_029593 [Nyssa sinensis]|uniref:Nucleic acid binding NABP domain-containing protein n=1 Tax=Nyssa sinensis TaxID=561372 RepID=A0A5J5B1F4_9ASTE|nr:hypothetical protein F0562_029593 [Nyssa sinensis]
MPISPRTVANSATATTAVVGGRAVSGDSNGDVVPDDTAAALYAVSPPSPPPSIPNSAISTTSRIQRHDHRLEYTPGWGIGPQTPYLNGSLFHKRIEPHIAKNLLTGFSTSDRDFRLEALNLSSEPQRHGSNQDSGPVAPAGKKPDSTTLNDPSMDGECISNSYLDSIGLRKAYLGSLLSPQKSQFGLPYLGESGSLNYGFYGNPTFGMGMPYPGSLLVGPLLPNSLIGSCSPVGLREQNMRFPYGMKNLAGAIMGFWHSEADEIAGDIVEFSTDQNRSRFIQTKT